ncbi:MAG: sugar phosphate isomerase/epimerase [Clostridia bacterium]|nr:sugar phosphate isomerase/epimerase [Clostridia bacterium]
MKLSSNFIRFHNEFGLKKTIDIFSSAGYTAIDFNADLEEYHTDAHDENFYKEIKEYAKSKGIVFAQTHAPFPSSFSEEEKTRKRFDEIVKSMKHSSLLGAEMTVVHPCLHINCKDSGNYALMMQLNLDFFTRLLPYAKAYDIKIAIENIPGSVTETPRGITELLRALDSDVFTVCFDVGHANICGQDPAQSIREIGKNIGCTHIHDNDGVFDRHTLPYYGKIDWENVMRAFAEISYEGNLNYEAGLFVDKVPVPLRESAAEYMAAVGKYLIERFCYYQKAVSPKE